MPPKQIFLSHSDLDRQSGMQLAYMLNQHGIAAWYSRTEIISAQQWIDAIGSALNRCD